MIRFEIMSEIERSSKCSKEVDLRRQPRGPVDDTMRLPYLLRDIEVRERKRFEEE